MIHEITRNKSRSFRVSCFSVRVISWIDLFTRHKNLLKKTRSCAFVLQIERTKKMRLTLAEKCLATVAKTCWLGGNVFSTQIHVKKFVITLIAQISLCAFLTLKLTYQTHAV